jgi:serine/threonine-protein kinase
MLHLLACLTLLGALATLLHPRFAGGRLAARSRLGHYTLGEKIGEGGMGVVYRAEHMGWKRPVAIKLLSPRRTNGSDIERFEREAQLTRSLQHPSTVAVYDVGRTRDGLPYYAMELVDGIDLQTLVERQGPLEPRRAARVLMQLSAALGELHAAGLIHRDVKPANVMLCESAGSSEAIKVLDFGLSLRVDGSVAAAPLLMGTPLYLPPEVITSPECLDPLSDIYSLGALGYFLLTGSPPFVGESLFELCGHHLHSSAVPPSQRLGRPIPARLEALIAGCLAKQPAQRPSSAALQAALLQLAGSTAFDDTSESTIPPQPAQEARATAAWPRRIAASASRHREAAPIAPLAA